ncbi:DUF6012 family protein [Pasteurella testudinis]|uniref:DUF6012 family protein n=1 Tax=Pasteurella testudinis TaxID=761 RepID=UPI00405A3BF0
MMLIHLMPTFINLYRNVTVNIKRLAISTENNLYEMDPTLLKVGKPFPNKSYHVVCRKKGNKAFQGLFAHLDDNPITFSVIEEWDVVTDNNSLGLIHYHYINFHLLNQEFNAVSQDMLMWDGYKLDIHKDWVPVDCQPKMEFTTNILGRGKRAESIRDGYYFNGEIKQRIEEYYVPTLSSYDLQIQLDKFYADRAPGINDGFNLINNGINV